MKSHKKLVIVGVVIVVLAALATAWYIKYDREAARKTAEVVAVANQFTPPENWKLTSETIHEAQFLCVDVVCPSVIRQWEFGAVEADNMEELFNVASLGGWSFEERSGCEVSDFMSDSATHMCYQRGKNLGFTTTLVLREDEGKPMKAILTVE